MAVSRRNAELDVNKAITPQSMDFFELLRQLETPQRRFGRSGDPKFDPARLGQAIRLAFAASDIVSVSKPDTPEHPPKVAVNVFGLFGPEGPMPLHLTRWMLERASNRWFAGDDENATSDTAFLDFGNMLQHRMISFYWRAWADLRPEVQMSHGTGGEVTNMIRALAGVRPTQTAGANIERSKAKLRHATSLFQQVQSPDRLTEYLATVTGQSVELTEFVGVWTDIPVRLQTKLGQKSSRLGVDAIVGSRFFERENRAEIKIGPLDLKDYKSFLDDPEQADELRHALYFAMGHGMEFDICLSLKVSEMPAPRLGEVRLGQIAWLGHPNGATAEDMKFRRFTQSANTAGIAA